MTPQQFLRSLQKQPPQPAYLFLGPEMYFRRMCRTALIDKVLPDPAQRDDGYIRHDLDEIPLAAVIDDARSLSLFAGARVLWIAAAESALPRGAAEGDNGPLLDYLKDPTPGTVLVFDAARYAFDGEDKTKIERVRKFYGGIDAAVEFARPDPREARQFVQELASAAGIRLGAAEIDLLVEATAGDPSRLANEIEKLALFSPGGASITLEDIAALVPNAREATVFALVNALARGDRKLSLSLIDTLIREGEYLPLVLTFLGGLLRYALAAREEGLRSAADVESHFRRMGAPMWRARAEQIWQVANRMPPERLAGAIDLVFRADRAFKSARPDDRLVLEDFLFRLTA